VEERSGKKKGILDSGKRSRSTPKKRTLELFLGRLVVAGGDHVDRDTGQRFAQQLGRVFFHLHDVAEIVKVFERAVLFFSAVTVLTDATYKAPST